MSRNPDGTFKTGDAETRESARKGGEASGGSRQAQHGQRHAKSSQQSQSSPDQQNGTSREKFEDDVETTRHARKRGENTQNMRPSDSDGSEDENDENEDENEQ